MKTKISILLLAGLVLSMSPAVGQHVYDSRIKENEMISPAAPVAPRINGPRVYGARPEREFLYRIPCQGERPIKFVVSGLPEGLTLDETKGIISGKTPTVKGNYEMKITARNRKGEDSCTFTIVVGDKLALTPPMGWNSWGGYMVDVSDKLVRHAADMMNERGFADVGYQYIGIDDCWMRVSQEMYDSRPENTVKKHLAYDYVGTGTIGDMRDANGRPLPNAKFPDMKAMTDYVHSYGLKAGIYSSPGPKTCQQWMASYGHERIDADQYAAWGFDLLKYDLCTGRAALNSMKKRIPGFTVKDFWRPMTGYIMDQERDILFNLCQYGLEEPWTWAPSINIQTWRIGGDLNHNVDHYFDNALRIAGELREYNKPGQWNDPDFLYIHRIKIAAHMGEPSVEIPLNTNQRYQYVTLWSIICAPFFFSCDLMNIDDFTVSLLTNAEVIALNQDQLGHTAEVVRDADKETVMKKNLYDGSTAVAVFNRDADKEAKIFVSWDEIGGCCDMHVRDLWRGTDLGIHKDGIIVRLSPQGVALLNVRPE